MAGEEQGEVKKRWIVENSWTCDACGHVNAGRDIKCQKCGDPKQRHEKDSVASTDESAEVTDAAHLAKAGAGANWVCSFCGSQERRGDGKCLNCGAGQDGAKEARAVGEEEPVKAPPPPEPKRRAMWPFVLLLLFGGFVCSRACSSHEAAAEVSAMHWKTTVTLERKTAIAREGFDPPSGAFESSCVPRPNGTHDCNPHRCEETVQKECNPHDCECKNVSKDLGNGFSEVQKVCKTCFDKCPTKVMKECFDQCPTISPYCRYKVWEWPKVKSEPLEGRDAKPRWAELTPANGDERVSRSSELEVTFTEAGKPLTFKPSDVAGFERFAPGQRWKLRVGPLGGVEPLERLP